MTCNNLELTLHQPPQEMLMDREISFPIQPSEAEILLRFDNFVLGLSQRQKNQ